VKTDTSNNGTVSLSCVLQLKQSYSLLSTKAPPKKHCHADLGVECKTIMLVWN